MLYTKYYTHATLCNLKSSAIVCDSWCEVRWCWWTKSAIFFSPWFQVKEFSMHCPLFGAWVSTLSTHTLYINIYINFDTVRVSHMVRSSAAQTTCQKHSRSQRSFHKKTYIEHEQQTYVYKHICVDPSQQWMMSKVMSVLKIEFSYFMCCNTSSSTWEKERERMRKDL